MSKTAAVAELRECEIRAAEASEQTAGVGERKHTLILVFEIHDPAVPKDPPIA